MKVLFLDIDGVLNDHTYNEVAGSNTIKSECVEHFNQIIAKVPDLRIVLSSAWRYMILNGAMTKSGFRHMLQTHGVSKEINVFDVLRQDSTQVEGDKGIRDRSEKIATWVRDYEAMTGRIDQWAALDDLALELDPEHFVRTDGKVGLTEQDALRVIEILNRR